MDYRELVLKTMNHGLTVNQQFLNGALGLAGESGEVADLLKKFAFQGHELPREKLIKELGDVRWYLELLCIQLCTTLAEVEHVNTVKLTTRFPSGFTKEASIRRVDKD